MTDEDRERIKIEYLKNYYYKRKNLLINSVNCVEELKNINLDQQNFEYYESF